MLKDFCLKCGFQDFGFYSSKNCFEFVDCYITVKCLDLLTGENHSAHTFQKSFTHFGHFFLFFPIKFSF